MEVSDILRAIKAHHIGSPSAVGDVAETMLKYFLGKTCCLVPVLDVGTLQRKTMPETPHSTYLQII